MNLDMNSPEAGFTMRDAYRSFMLNWPWIVAFALLGGLGGFVVSLLRPPLYRAENTVILSAMQLQSLLTLLLKIVSWIVWPV
jgi:uncharacterized protein involved in exopolysaccharide biosynthesis